MHATVALSTNGLIHRYSFSESGNSFAFDSIGSTAWNGQLLNGAQIQDGSLVLDWKGGSSPKPYVLLPKGVVGYADDQAVSVELWVTTGDMSPCYFNGQGTINGNFYNRLFEFETGCIPSQTSGMAMNRDPNFGCNICVTRGGTCAPGDWHSHACSSTPFSNQVNTHLVATYSNTEVKIYVNGLLASTSGSATIQPPDSYLYNIIGSYEILSAHGLENVNGNPSGLMKTLISEFRIYEGILSSETVKENFVLGPDLLTPNQVKTSVPSLNPTVLKSTPYSPSVACGNDADYFNIVKSKFKSYFYTDFSNRESYYVSPSITRNQISIVGNLEGVSSGGVFNGSWFDASKGNDQIIATLPPGVMSNDGVIIAFWCYSTQSKMDYSTTFTRIRSEGRELYMSDEGVFGSAPNSGQKPGFRVTQWVPNHWTFLFGGSNQGSGVSELPLNTWTHVLIYINRNVQTVYFDGKKMDVIYQTASGTYAGCMDKPIQILLPGSSTREIFKISNYVVAFGDYSVEQALSLYSCQIGEMKLSAASNAKPKSNYLIARRKSLYSNWH